ncbi:MAG TPA: MarR family winged helix-turn-helix transcriptional regulator [Candidatus Methylomirabilis sp.]|nr:MarR family winged helix-turn-helix transcriptional regulator [Candidatus Methylomirabilis sp.]
MKTRTLTQQCARIVIGAVPLVMRSIRGEIRRQSAPLLSVPQVRTLAFLQHHPGACLYHLAEHLGVTRPTASILVDRLVNRSLVARTPDPAERRRVVLTLTAQGARRFERARRSTEAWIGVQLAGLPPGDLRRIVDGLTVLEGVFIEPSTDGRQDATPSRRTRPRQRQAIVPGRAGHAPPGRVSDASDRARRSHGGEREHPAPMRGR